MAAKHPPWRAKYRCSYELVSGRRTERGWVRRHHGQAPWACGAPEAARSVSIDVQRLGADVACRVPEDPSARKLLLTSWQQAVGLLLLQLLLLLLLRLPLLPLLGVAAVPSAYVATVAAAEMSAFPAPAAD